MLLYAVDDAHGITVGWISNRNALVAGVFGVGALLVHDRWRRGGWKPGIGLGPALTLIALLAAESAVAVCGFVFAQAVCLEDGKWRQRLSGLIPFAVVVIVWRVAYTSLGYGVAGTDLYVDPIREPLTFGRALVERLPVFLMGQFAFPPAEAWIVISDRGRELMTYSGVVVLLGVLALTWPVLKRRREARFFGLSALLATVPLCATYPFDRLLVFVGVGAMGLVALAVSAPVDGESTAVTRRRGASLLVGAWLCLHLIVAPILLPVRAFYPSELDAIMARVDETLPKDEALEDQTLVVVNTPDFSLSFYLLMRRAALLEPLPEFIRFLSISDQSIIAERENEKTLTLHWNGGLFARPMERMFRGRRFPFAVGETYRLTGFEAKIVEITDDGRPRTVQFRFSSPLEDPSLRWVSWGKRGFEPFVLPGVGERKVLPAVDFYDQFGEL
jgi:hypothetical protein